MPPIPFWQVDAFTDEPYSGNPAAVVLLDAKRKSEWMQTVAAEMNLSETAFLNKIEPDRYALRWFTPTSEVKLCGHATLAAAWVLMTELNVSIKRISFATCSGPLAAERVDGGVCIDLPELPCTSWNAPPALLKALGLDGVEDSQLSTAAENALLRLPDAEDLRALKPDFAALKAVRAPGLGGVIVTARGNDVDFVSRYFTPWYGIDEDPVTGSAHSTLAPYWAGVFGKDKFRARQVSARGGNLDVRREAGRVYLAGGAVTVIRGELIS